jgi:hypothetical protein
MPVQSTGWISKELERIEAHQLKLDADLIKLRFEGESLEEARKQINTKTPFGSEVFTEKVVSDGKPKKITETGKTIEEAFRKGRARMPEGAKIVQETELTQPGERNVTVNAFDETEARKMARQASKPAETIQSCLMIELGKRGFLGFGRKPSRYEFSLFQNATVEIVAKTNACIQVAIGSKELVQEIRLLNQQAMSLRSTLDPYKSSVPETRTCSSPISSR